MRRSSIRFNRRATQRGQALIYGIFLLIGGLASLFFLFNTGQLTREKTKLANTTDAVAYAAGVVEARALNFNAYANRALVANEVLIAQMVSLSSWSQYVGDHIDGIPDVFARCPEPIASYYIPWGGGFFSNAALVGGEYSAACNVLTERTYNVGEQIKQYTSSIPTVAEGVVAGVEVVKGTVKGGVDAMHLGLRVTRARVMQDLADANYRSDGGVSVDVIPVLSDDWGGFTKKYSGDDRERFAEVTRLAAYGDNTGDAFVRDRSWTASQLIPTDWQCMADWKRNEVQRRGGTRLVNYDEWSAGDSVTYLSYSGGFTWWGRPKCSSRTESIGRGSQDAQATSDSSSSSSSSSSTWSEYTGLPSFYDLSPAMLAKNSNLDESDAALLKFTVRLRRKIRETVTSEGRSGVVTTPTLNNYHAQAAQDVATGDRVLSEIATSEVFFRRPEAQGDNSYGRSQGKPVELGSLFNPYWQVRLVQSSASDRAAARALQGSAGF